VRCLSPVRRAFKIKRCRAHHGVRGAEILGAEARALVRRGDGDGGALLEEDENVAVRARALWGSGAGVRDDNVTC
jgi:hypothetical protein